MKEGTKMKKKAVFLCFTILIMSFICSSNLSPVLSHSGNIINAPMTSNIPSINGLFDGSSEWVDAFQIHITSPFEAYLYFKYNGTHLFICVDVIGDIVAGMIDYVRFYFDTNHDGSPTSGEDDSFLIYAFPFYAHYIDDSAAGYNPTYHCDFSSHPGLIGGIGFSSSPNSGTNHRIFEIQIPLDVLDVSPGETLGFGVENYDQDNGQFIYWPTGFNPATLTTWGDIVLSSEEIDIQEITNVIQNPISPNQYENVDITANITSENTITNATIWFSINGSGWNIAIMNLITGTAQNGLWNGILPNQPLETNVSYYIYAEDNLNLSTKVGPYSYIVSESEPPEIIDHTRIPSFPISSQVVSINASLKDDSGIKNADLFFKVNDSSTWNVIAMNLISGTSYNGIWNCTIPAFGNGTTIKYYFSICDNLNNSGVFPANAPEFYYGYYIGLNDTQPLIVNDITIYPLIPSYQDNITIKASINMTTEVSGIKNLTLCYSQNYQNLNYIQMDYSGRLGGLIEYGQNASNLLAINDTLGGDGQFFNVLRSWGGYNVTSISLDDVIADPSIADSYDVILIGDSSNTDGWNASWASIIADTGKPIVARSEDGADFVFALGMSYTDYATLVVSGSSAQQIDPVQSSHPVVNYPYILPSNFAVDTTYTRTSCIFNTSDPSFDKIGYASTVTWNRINLGHYKGYTNNDKIFLWAYEGYFGEAYVTPQVKNLCVNMVEFVYNLSLPLDIPYSILNFSAILPKFALGDTIQFNITSYDNAGNSYTSPTYNFTITDPFSPVLDVTFSPSEPDNSQEVQVTVNAKEINASGVQNLTLYYAVNETATLNLESAHKVPNEYNYIWNISIPECYKMEIIFENITLEEGFDYLYVLNETHDLVEEITGNHNNYPVIVFGNTTRLQLKTDFAVESWGFLLSMIKFHYLPREIPMSLSTGTIYDGNWTANIPKQMNISQVLFNCKSFDFSNNSAESPALFYLSSERTPPSIIQTIRTPNDAFLKPSASTIITTQVSDNFGLLTSGVILQYSIDGSWANQTTTTNSTEYPIGIGYWEGTIPGQSDGDVVIYRIIAQDITGNIAISGNFSYIIDGSAPKIEASSQTPVEPQYNDSVSLKFKLTDKYPIFEGSGINTVRLDYCYSIDYVIESPHPYPNYYNNTWIINHPGAMGIAAHFSQITLSSGDFIEVYDANENLLQNLTSSGINVWTLSTNTNMMKIRLITNSAGTNYGFILDQYRVYSLNFMTLVSGTICDGFWIGTIPSFSYGTSVWYNITAKDNAQNQAMIFNAFYSIGDEYQPQIINFLISTTTPSINEDVNITIEVSDLGSGIQDVELILSTDGGLNWISIPFINSNNIWQVTIPRQPDQTEVKYYIKIYDNSGNLLRNPDNNYYTIEFSGDQIVSKDWLLILIISITAFAAVIFLLVLRSQSQIKMLEESSKQPKREVLNHA